MRKTIVFFMTLVMLFSLCACGNGEDANLTNSENTQVDFNAALDSAKKACKYQLEEFKRQNGLVDSVTFSDVGGFKISSDGKTMSFESGAESERLDRAVQFRTTLLAAVLKKLKISESTVFKISNTRAIDGIQTDESEDLKLTWSYHPDEGLSIIFEKKD